MRATVAVLSLLPGLQAVLSLKVGFSSYDDDFIDPNYVLSKSFNATTVYAQASIAAWADWLNAQGPWAVTTSKPFSAPSGDPHDYLSWAPYWWPDCSNAGNTTQLTDQQIWTTCPYHQQDGDFNPDVRTVNNTGAFDALSNAVLYNSLAWVLSGSPKYSANVVSYVKTWFLDPDTKMNPNLNYGQVQRGPGQQVGTHTGVLDLKGMAKLVNGILILRLGKSPDWTSDLDAQLIAWSRTYIQWLETSPIALDEAAATNNHGSYYFTQLASLKILVNDNDGAQATLKQYFSTLYQNQIAANGEQPLEAVRTRPYHYRSYNLAAMITNARLAQYTGYSAWNTTTSAGGTIHAALDFAMTIPPDDDGANELYSSIAAVASVYGDPQGKYVAFLTKAEYSYPENPWFFWNQPFSDSGWARTEGLPVSGGLVSSSVSSKGAAKPTASSSHGTTSTSPTENGGISVRGNVGILALSATIATMFVFFG
ncbi:chondroitin AC/alginate lyase [Artomyces pyxidatus]|uniref:Chondroitin AC/alginate lyase n=1 Tax=Artomyces pyxidatus TaxID=48021 RepID=A0ACB8SY03_9AGAM|nr:chondroitin AC/alginate lyase [Artomyces pyxidatus]